MTDKSQSLDKLKSSIEQARKDLKTTDEEIKKLTGRDPAEILNFGRRLMENSNKGNEGNRQFTNFAKKRHLNDDSHSNLDPASKRQHVFSQITFGTNRDVSPQRIRGDIHNRLAGNRWEGRNGPPRVPKREENEDTRNVLTSSVVRVAEKSRQEAIMDMKRSESNAEQQRGKRMLGVLLGTLKRFKTEAAVDEASTMTQRRHQLDRKIDAKTREEKLELRKERVDMFRERKDKQIRIRKMQQAMRMFEGFKKWEVEIVNMKSFIRTERKPYIFYRPRIHNDRSEKQLANSCKSIDEMISKRRVPIEDEIARLTTELEEANPTIKEEHDTKSGSENGSSPKSVTKKLTSHQHDDANQCNSSDDDSGDNSDEAGLVDVALEKMEEEEEDYEDDIAADVAKVATVSPSIHTRREVIITDDNNGVSVTNQV